jgi:hypothetical protein
VSFPPVKSGHFLIDGATLASVIGKKLSAFFAMQNVDDGTSRLFATDLVMSAIGRNLLQNSR